MNVEVCPSPNHGARIGGPVDILLLHYTGMLGPSEDALRWLCDPRSEVSCHYFVYENGRVLSLVAEERRAWHAGASVWGGESDINSRSIGIEIANSGHPGGLPDYPDAQIAAVIALCQDIVGRHPIPPHRVLAHSDVAPGRKLDPGERFPWARLAQSGIGLWVEPPSAHRGARLTLGNQGSLVEALQSLLALYGYGLDVSGVFDRRSADVVAAFQRHFRPSQVDGAADPGTVAILRALIEAIA